MKTDLTAEYWNDRYHDDNFPWDAGQITPPIKQYFDKITNKEIRILIPGCGNAHEAKYLHEQGFKNVFLCDWAEKPLLDFHKSVVGFPKEHLLHMDFFKLEMDFDYIIEQTFFCAIDPKLRPAYVKQMHSLLPKGGKLVGLMFNMEFPSGPPFGGNINEYKELFVKHFTIEKMELCRNSITPRMGSEIFIELTQFG